MINKIINYIIILIILGTAGCGWFHKAPKPAVKDSVSSPLSVKEGKIVRAEVLKKGGTVQIIPFTAGVGVAAGEELDRISLQIVKSATTVIHQEMEEQKGRPPLKVIFGPEGNNADFQILGHVTEVKKSPSTLKKWVLFKKESKGIAVKGRMIHRRTGETILLFQDHVELKSKDSDYQELAEKIGENIGSFVLSVAEN